MKHTLEYKGYMTKIEYSVEDKVLYGKIEGIRDLVNFESDDANQIETEFHNAVDDYLAMCEELNVEPDKNYSGTFNVRIAPELHRKLAMKAIEKDCTLNHYVEIAIQAYIEGSGATGSNYMQAMSNAWSAISNYVQNVANVNEYDYAVTYASANPELKVI